MSRSQTGSHVVSDFAEIEPTRCPCGWARRTLVDVAGSPLSLHQTEITLDAKAHYHKRLTEVYYFLECDQDARMELDGQQIPVKPGMSVYIPPGTRHRAVGKMKVMIAVVPRFEPEDEWFD